MLTQNGGHACASWYGDMGDRYLKEELNIVLHIRVGGIDGKSRNFCAVFNGAANPTKIDFTYARREVYIPSANLLENNVQQAVLVGVVKSLEGRKNAGITFIPSVVRLRSLDECLRSGTDLVDHVYTGNKLSGIVKDWKLEGAGVSRRLIASVPEGRPINGVIESRPEAMDTIRRDERPSVQVGHIVDFDNDAMAASVMVTLFEDGVGARVLPRDNFTLQRIEVFLSPANLGNYIDDYIPR